MKPLRSSYALGYRLSWMFAALAMLSLGLASFTIYWQMAQALHQRSLQELEVKATLIRHLLAEANAPQQLPLVRHKLDDLLKGHTDLAVQLADERGRPLYASTAEAGPPGPSVARRFALPWTGGHTTVTATVRMDTRHSEALLRRLVLVLAVVTVGATATVTGGAFLLVRFGLAPLRALARQTEQLTPQRLDQRLAVSEQAHELQPWIRQLNGLLDRLQAAYQQLESFNAAVAHELRTPLAVAITRGEVALGGPRNEADLRESLGDNLHELRGLAAIVNDMLFLSRADRGASARWGAPGPLSAPAHQVLDYHAAELAEAGLSARVVGEAQLRFDAALIRRALSNLVSNAVRHATPGSVLTLRIVSVDAGCCRVTVENQGPTIAPDALPRLFERFYRVAAAGEAGGAHHGLGLAIVAAIARMHGGSAFARSAGGVTAIGMVLPTPHTMA